MKLFWKIYLTTTAFVLLSVTLLTAVVSYRESSRSLAELRSTQRLLGTLAASQVEAGYHENIWPFEMLKAIADEPSVTSWQVVDGAGHVVLAAMTGHRHENGAIAPSSLTDSLPGPVLAESSCANCEVWVLPLRMRTNARPWTFALEYHRGSISAQVVSLVSTNALCALGVCVFLLPLSLFVTRRFLEPLTSLTSAVKELDAGRSNMELPQTSNDEVGALIRAFNAMSHSLRDRDEKIRAHVDTIQRSHEQLGARVEERTVELREAQAHSEAAAAAARESEARMRAIIEHAADAVVATDEHGRLEVFNPAAERIFGVSAGNVTELTLGRFLAPPFRLTESGELACMRPDGLAETIGRSGEVLGLRANGTSFPLQIALSEVTLGDRRGFIGVLRDISERKRAEYAHEELHQQLVAASRLAGKAEVAIGVLHNVGNTLNSINVSVAMLARNVGQSQLQALRETVAVLEQHRHDLVSFITEDPRGQHLLPLLSEVCLHLEHEHDTLRTEIEELGKFVEHVSCIVSLQQDHVHVGSVSEETDLASVLDDALRVCASSYEKYGIGVNREFDTLSRVWIDKHKFLQIVINLVRNAGESVSMSPSAAERRVTVRLLRGEGERVRVEVSDTGVGISPENLARIFNHGFTTKKLGHGFGLHSSALSAREMSGSLTVASAGVGRGATFILEVPCLTVASAPAA